MAWTPRIPASSVLASRARRNRREAAATAAASRAVLAQAALATRRAITLHAQAASLRLAPRVAFAMAGEGAADRVAPQPAAGTARAVARAPRPAFRVVAEVSDGVTFVIVSGDVDLATAPEVEHCLQAHAGARRLVVDLAGVGFLDSCGMTVLVRAMRRAAQSGQDLALRPPADRAAMRALEITGLLGALPFERAAD
jgi:stage II sporulation protein AA (anti-sigma F factor antagonist)